MAPAAEVPFNWYYKCNVYCPKWTVISFHFVHGWYKQRAGSVAHSALQYPTDCTYAWHNIYTLSNVQVNCIPDTSKPHFLIDWSSKLKNNMFMNSCKRNLNSCKSSHTFCSLLSRNSWKFKLKNIANVMLSFEEKLIKEYMNILYASKVVPSK